MMKTALGRLRVIGMIEGISLLVLMFIAMPLKYLADQPLAVKYVGWAHGILFIAFMLAAFVAYMKYHWPFKRLVYAFLAAFLPFGTFVFDKWLRKQEAVSS
ncbi:MAG: rane protein [Chitinophagaceae bacterium]|jgi:integral membrane protein|nr:rane protein [Chitinophagaceae bacterium]